ARLPSTRGVGAVVWADGELSECQGGQITLQIPAAFLSSVRAVLAQIPADAPFVVLTDPAPPPRARLVWQPGQTRAATLAAPRGQPSGLTGGFVAFRLSTDGRDGGRGCEDGFLVGLSPAAMARGASAFVQRVAV